MCLNIQQKQNTLCYNQPTRYSIINSRCEYTLDSHFLWLPLCTWPCMWPSVLYTSCSHLLSWGIYDWSKVCNNIFFTKVIEWKLKLLSVIAMRFVLHSSLRCIKQSCLWQLYVLFDNIKFWYFLKCYHNRTIYCSFKEIILVYDILITIGGSCLYSVLTLTSTMENYLIMLI